MDGPIFVVMKTGYLIDMDGVIYRDNQLIPGAGDFVQSLLSSGAPFLFLTNNSAPTPEDLAVRLGHLGIPGISPRHFYTSALNTADFLSETHPGCTVLALGEGGLMTALHERKIANDAIDPSYVVIGEGAVSMEKLTKAHECIEKGARLLATNSPVPLFAELQLVPLGRDANECAEVKGLRAQPADPAAARAAALVGEDDASRADQDFLFCGDRRFTLVGANPAHSWCAT